MSVPVSVLAAWRMLGVALDVRRDRLKLAVRLMSGASELRGLGEPPDPMSARDAWASVTGDG